MAAETIPLHPAERQAPVALEAEVSVVGACMLDPDALSRVLEIHGEEALFREPHRRIFRAMVGLHERGDVVEPIQVAEELKRVGDLEEVGGHPYLSELLGAVVTAANVEYHARTVLDRYRLRQVIAASEATIREAYQGGDADSVLDAAERRILELGHARQAGDVVWIKNLLYPTFERIEQLQDAPGGITGVPSGFPDLDYRTGGFQKGDLVILAARPSMGKTALLISILLHAAITAKKKVALFSFEMSKEQLVQRMLCSEALVDLQRLRRGRLNDDDFVRLAQASGHLSTAPLFLDYAAGGRVNDIRGKARRLIKKEGGIDIIAVDYLQLMTAGNRENRNQDVTEITRGLKALAMELEVPLIALSQLSRAPEQRSGHRPQLSDLRDSGSIEQDADVVLFVHRPDYYMSEEDAREKGVVGHTELIIGKQRNGPTDTVKLFFRSEAARFESMAMGKDGRK